MLPSETKSEGVQSGAALGRAGLQAVVDKSELAGMISTAHRRADGIHELADRLEAIVAGLTGEDTGPRGGMVDQPSCGLTSLGVALDRADSGDTRMGQLIDRLNLLVAI